LNYMIYNENCIDAMKRLEDNSVDSIVTDPPYGLSFMGKKWDYDVPSTEIWAECLRVLKPGGHLLAFAGTRTQHRMAVRIEDAGFEIRDMIAWVYGSGFPKSLDVSKAIDKAAGAEREVVGQKDVGPDMRGGNFKTSEGRMVADITAPTTEAAQQWQGWGTALKPALEPITVARKPLIGTVAANVLEHGTGALNIDGCRVGATVETWPKSRSFRAGISSGYTDGIDKGKTQSTGKAPDGRWPANLIHDGSDEVLVGFPDAKGQHGDLKETGRARPSSGRFGDMAPPVAHKARIETDTSAARFFYCAKASKKDRDEGLEGFEKRVVNITEGHGMGEINTSKGGDGIRENRPRANVHPTVKPTDLMRYLCRLVTPPGGVVLDPFAGSGSTGKAAMLEGFSFIGCELSEEYAAIANARIEAAIPKDLFA
jgi:DNA modification methylase